MHVCMYAYMHGGAVLEAAVVDALGASGAAAVLVVRAVPAGGLRRRGPRVYLQTAELGSGGSDSLISRSETKRLMIKTAVKRNETKRKNGGAKRNSTKWILPSYRAPVCS